MCCQRSQKLVNHKNCLCNVKYFEVCHLLYPKYRVPTLEKTIIFFLEKKTQQSALLIRCNLLFTYTRIITIKNVVVAIIKVVNYN